MAESPIPAANGTAAPAAPTAGRDAMIAGLKEIATAEAKGKPEDKNAAAPPAPAAEGVEKKEAAPEGEAPEGEPPPAAPEPEPAKEPEPDPPRAEDKGAEKLAKNLEAIHRAKRRADQEITQRMASIRQAEAKLAEREAAIQRQQKTEASVEELRARAMRDPVGTLEALGVPRSQMDYVAKQAYLLGKAATEKPEFREQALAEQRERERMSIVEAVRAEAELARKETAEMRTQLEAEKQAQQTRQQVHEYVEAVASQVDEATPIVRTWLQKNPARARQALYSLADHMARTQGEVPDPKDVIATLEAHRRAELEEAGFDPALLSKTGTSKTTKTTTPAAGERKAARTLSGDLSTPTPPRTAPLSPQEERARLVRALESGNLD